MAVTRLVTVPALHYPVVIPFSFQNQVENNYDCNCDTGSYKMMALSSNNSILFFKMQDKIN